MESLPALSGATTLTASTGRQEGLAAERVTSAEGMRALQGDWDRLWQAQPRREIFTSYAWCATAWAAQQPGPTPEITVVRRLGVVVGLLALARTGSGLAFMGSPWSDYNDILVADPDPAAVAAMALDAALSGRNGFGRLAEIPEWSILAQHLHALPPRLRARLAVEPGADCPALRLDSDRNALLREMTGKKSLKRHEKKLERIGPVTLRHLTSRESARAGLADFYEQHIARRAIVGDRSLFLDAPGRRFYEGLIDVLDPSAELRFSVLEAGGRPVAYHFGFQLGGRFTWYKPSFDVDLLEIGAGEVLIKRLLEYLADQPVDEFDFTRGNESFKDRFSNHRGRNVHWIVRRSGLEASLQRARLRLVERAKATPWVVGLHERLRRRSIAAPADSAPPARFAPAFGAMPTTAKPGLIGAKTVGRAGLRELALRFAHAATDEAHWWSVLTYAVANGAVCVWLREGDVALGAALREIAAPASGAATVPIIVHSAPGTTLAPEDLVHLWTAATEELAAEQRAVAILCLPGNAHMLPATAVQAGFRPLGANAP